MGKPGIFIIFLSIFLSRYFPLTFHAAVVPFGILPVTSSIMKLTPGCLLTATASQLQQGLAAGAFTSVDLVEASLAQINKHDAYLRVITSKPPRSQLLAIAKRLDDERAAGKSRSGLHGIPILLKVSAFCIMRGAVRFLKTDRPITRTILLLSPVWKWKLPLGV